MKDRVPKLSIGDVRVFRQLLEDCEGEQAELRGIGLPLRERHLGRGLDGLGREKCNEIATRYTLSARRVFREGEGGLPLNLPLANLTAFLSCSCKSNLGSRYTEVGRVEFAFCDQVLSDGGRPGGRSGIAAVKYDPYKRSLVPYRIERLADHVVGECVRYALRPVRPHACVGRQ
ncbi:MAG: hypothetical protein IH582_15000 [Afipia sp.]|nr:hypothetical protein [Afipia sp.]